VLTPRVGQLPKPFKGEWHVAETKLESMNLGGLENLERSYSCKQPSNFPEWISKGTDLQLCDIFRNCCRVFNDPNLCRNTTEYTNNHEYKDATEIKLHFINIKKLKFVHKQNGNKLAKALVAYL
jgi:hypothetical protein